MASIPTILVYRRLEHRDVKRLSPGHTASEWQSWDLRTWRQTPVCPWPRWKEGTSPPRTTRSCHPALTGAESGLLVCGRLNGLLQAVAPSPMPPHPVTATSSPSSLSHTWSEDHDGNNRESREGRGRRYLPAQRPGSDGSLGPSPGVVGAALCMPGYSAASPASAQLDTR